LFSVLAPPGTKSPQLAGIGQSELQRPAPYRLIGDINAALGEQILDVAIAERKAHFHAGSVDAVNVETGRV
jgi:hypothetical protein